MRSFRSKPVGWRGESHRHYLASKGIASKIGGRGPNYLAAKGVRTSYSAPKVSEMVIGGLADGRPDGMFDKRQLEKGIAVESEHTNNPKIAKEIAKDHLMEDAAYYDKLAKMEYCALKVRMKEDSPAGFVVEGLPKVPKRVKLADPELRVAQLRKDQARIELELDKAEKDFLEDPSIAHQITLGQARAAMKSTEEEIAAARQGYEYRFFGGEPYEEG